MNQLADSALYKPDDEIFEGPLAVTDGTLDSIDTIQVQPTASEILKLEDDIRKLVKLAGETALDTASTAVPSEGGSAPCTPRSSTADPEDDAPLVLRPGVLKNLEEVKDDGFAF